MVKVKTLVSLDKEVYEKLKTYIEANTDRDASMVIEKLVKGYLKNKMKGGEEKNVVVQETNTDGEQPIQENRAETSSI